MIRYKEIIKESVVDGNGIRLVAFLQGCPFSCDCCHNPSLQTTLGGKEATEEEFVKTLLSMYTEFHSGITFSGGEPLMQVDALYKVITLLKQKKPNINIWVYTGYIFEEVKHFSVMSLIDILVDGQFILSKRNLSLPFRGSTNQRIIDVYQSIQRGESIEVV